MFGSIIREEIHNLLSLTEIGSWLAVYDYYEYKYWYDSRFGLWSWIFFIIFYFPIALFLIYFHLITNFVNFLIIISNTSVAVIFYYFLGMVEVVIKTAFITPGMLRADLLEE